MSFLSELKRRKTTAVVLLVVMGITCSPFIFTSILRLRAAHAIMNAKQLEFIWHDFETNKGKLDPNNPDFGLPAIHRTCVVTDPALVHKFGRRIGSMKFEKRSLWGGIHHGSAGEPLHVIVRSKSGNVSAELWVHPFSQIFVGGWQLVEFSTPRGTRSLLVDAAREMYLKKPDVAQSEMF